MGTIVQRIALTLDYPVCFSDAVFNAKNPDLAAALSRKEPARRQRCLFVIEERVAELWPCLAQDIQAYAAAHASSLELTGAPLVVRGGEDCKNDDRAPAQLLARFEAEKLDRQSHVVIVGGGALQDLVGYAAAIAFILFLMIAFATLLQMRFQEKRG